VKRRLRAIAGTDFGVHSPRWLSRFGDATRQAEHYRSDGCTWRATPRTYHLRSAAGVNLGIQDAFNLGWKLAAELRLGTGRPAGYLPCRAAPGGRGVLNNTRAQSELMATGPGPQAVRGS
jgi:hypothetical protein